MNKKNGDAVTAIRGEEGKEIVNQESVNQKKMKKEKVKKEKRMLSPAEKKRRKKRVRNIILLAVLAAVILFFAISCSRGSSNVNIVTTVNPVIGSVEEEISTSGVVESEESKVYFAAVSGRLADIYVEAGDVVQKGDLLVSYDMDYMEDMLTQAQFQYQVSNSSYGDSLAVNSDAQQKLNEANRNLAVLKQQITDIKAYIKALKEELSAIQTKTTNELAAESMNLQKKMIELQKDPVNNADAIAEIQIAMQTNQYVSQIAGTSGAQPELQKEIAAYEEMLAECQAYQAEMEAQKTQAQAQVLSDYQKNGLSATQSLNSSTLEAAQTDYDTAQLGITAAYNGIVTEVGVVEGATVNEGMQLLTLESSEQIKVSFFVTKYDLAKLALGQKADVTINNKVYEGTIEKIDRMATTNASGTAMVGAQIHLENPDENIYLGLDAKLTIHTNRAENVLLIPVESLNADKEGDFVYVEENGIVVRKPIVTGISSAEYIEVKEGLSETDRVITASYTGIAIEEGMPVYIMPKPVAE